MIHANSYATITEQVDFSAPEDIRAQVSVEGGYQAALERDVVVRRLGPAASDPRLRGRFLREVKALAQLRHHTFVHVYDAGVKDDVPFAVFERLHGITAQHRIELLADRQARMDPEEAVRIVESVAEAVGYARRQGVRVYDVTPGNIVLAEDQRVVLTGLGEPLPENPLTAPTTLLAYAAPERLFGASGAGDEPALAAAPAVAAVEEPALAPAAPAALEPVEMGERAEAGLPVPEFYDLLMPGRDNPSLAAALPFTILVPMPQDAGEEVVGRHAQAQAMVPMPRYVAVLMMLCMLAIGAAMVFG